MSAWISYPGTMGRAGRGTGITDIAQQVHEPDARNQSVVDFAEESTLFLVINLDLVGGLDVDGMGHILLAFWLLC